jgi:NAD(P)H dehydrogenase (quinone)
VLSLLRLLAWTNRYTVAEAIKKGIENEGGHATILQVAETLPAEILARMSAPPKRDYPIATPADLLQYDAYMFGIAARYGGWPAQFKTFWDATGKLWIDGALTGKFAGAFVSSGGQGGGQESSFYSALSTFVHHGLVYVPLVSNILPQTRPASCLSRVINTRMPSGVNTPK